MIINAIREIRKTTEKLYAKISLSVKSPKQTAHEFPLFKNPVRKINMKIILFNFLSNFFMLKANIIKNKG